MLCDIRFRNRILDIRSTKVVYPCPRTSRGTGRAPMPRLTAESILTRTLRSGLLPPARRAYMIHRFVFRPDADGGGRSVRTAPRGCDAR